MARLSDSLRHMYDNWVSFEPIRHSFISDLWNKVGISVVNSTDDLERKSEERRKTNLYALSLPKDKFISFSLIGKYPGEAFKYLLGEIKDRTIVIGKNVVKLTGAGLATAVTLSVLTPMTAIMLPFEAAARGIVNGIRSLFSRKDREKVVKSDVTPKSVDKESEEKFVNLTRDYLRSVYNEKNVDYEKALSLVRGIKEYAEKMRAGYKERQEVVDYRQNVEIPQTQSVKETEDMFVKYVREYLKSMQKGDLEKAYGVLTGMSRILDRLEKDYRRLNIEDVEKKLADIQKKEFTFAVSPAASGKKYKRNPR